VPHYIDIQRLKESGGVIFDSLDECVVFYMPFYDAARIKRGFALFSVAVRSIADALLDANLIRASDSVSIVSNGILLNTVADAGRIVGEIWEKSERDEKDKTSQRIIHSNTDSYILLSKMTREGFFVGCLVAKGIFLLPEFLKIITVIVFGTTVFVILFFAMNIKSDPVVLIQQRIQNFQLSFLTEYFNYKNKHSDQWRNEFAGRKEDIRAELKRGFSAKELKKTEDYINSFFDNAWDELIRFVKASPDVLSVDENKMEHIFKRIVNAAVDITKSPSASASPSAKIATPKEPSDDNLEDLEELEDLEDLEDLEELEDLDGETVSNPVDNGESKIEELKIDKALDEPCSAEIEVEDIDYKETDSTELDSEDLDYIKLYTEKPDNYELDSEKPNDEKPDSVKTDSKKHDDKKHDDKKRDDKKRDDKKRDDKKHDDKKRDDKKHDDKKHDDKKHDDKKHDRVELDSKELDSEDPNDSELDSVEFYDIEIDDDKANNDKTNDKTDDNEIDDWEFDDEEFDDDKISKTGQTKKNKLGEKNMALEEKEDDTNVKDITECSVQENIKITHKILENDPFKELPPFNKQSIETDALSYGNFVTSKTSSDEVFLKSESLITDDELDNFDWDDLDNTEVINQVKVEEPRPKAPIPNDKVVEFEEASESDLKNVRHHVEQRGPNFTFEDPRKGSNMNKMAMRIEFEPAKESASEKEMDFDFSISSPENEIFIPKQEETKSDDDPNANDPTRLKDIILPVKETVETEDITSKT
jgi:hypothetical protein